jgi:hypothetical protein
MHAPLRVEPETLPAQQREHFGAIDGRSRGFRRLQAQRIRRRSSLKENDQLHNDVRESYSNFGSCVDLWATVPAFGGTSTATAFVSGAAAQQLQLVPWLPPSFVQNRVLTNATSGVLSGVGSGSPNRLWYSRQPPLTLQWYGPHEQLGPGSWCSWSGLESGGQPPYSYEWRRDGVLVASGPQYAVSAVGPVEFALTVRVIDGVGRSADTGRFITVDPSNTDDWCGGL